MHQDVFFLKFIHSSFSDIKHLYVLFISVSGDRLPSPCGPMPLRALVERDARAMEAAQRAMEDATKRMEEASRAAHTPTPILTPAHTKQEDGLLPPKRPMLDDHRLLAAHMGVPSTHLKITSRSKYYYIPKHTPHHFKITSRSRYIT